MTSQEQAPAASEGVSVLLRALPKPKVQIKSYRLQLSGTSGQYLRVWFVNMLLPILTLCLFTPWARKRTAEYFLCHSAIEKSPLEFTSIIKRMVLSFFIFLGLSVVFDDATKSANLLVVRWRCKVLRNGTKHFSKRVANSQWLSVYKPAGACSWALRWPRCCWFLYFPPMAGR